MPSKFLPTRSSPALRARRVRLAMLMLCLPAWLWACSNLTSKTLGTVAGGGAFTGLASAQLEGKSIVLVWSPYTQLSADSSYTPTYRVYQGADFSQVIYQGPETSYDIPVTGKATGSQWTYGVRVIGEDGTPDTNTVTQTVTITSTSGLSFPGLTLTGVSLAADYSSLQLSWPAATKGSGTVQYQVFGDAGFTKLIGESATTSWSLAQPTPGNVYTFAVHAVDANGPDENTAVVVYTVPPLSYAGCDTAANTSPGRNTVGFSLPAWASQVVINRNGAPVGSAATAAESPFTDAAAPVNGTSLYQCNAVTSAGTVVAGAKILSAVSLSNLSFSGLSLSGVTLMPDNSALTLSWPAATGAVGNLQYFIYSDAGFTNLIGQAAGTSWQLAAPTPGSSYTFAVRAQDSTGFDANKSVVIYQVPPLSYGGCSTATNLSPGHNSIAFSLPAWASSVVISRDGTPVHTAATTAESPFLDAGAPVSGTSHYQCNAVTASGTVVSGSLLRTAQSISNLNFAGLASGGVTLASTYATLTLSWAAATGTTGPVTYYIYGDSAFTHLIGETATTTWTVAQPVPGTVYTYGVRAQDNTGQDANTALVVYTVPPQIYSGCTTAVNLSPGKNRITFSIPAWATGVAISRDGTTVHTAASVSESPYTDASAPVNGTSHYQCNAITASGGAVNGAQILPVTSTSTLSFTGLSTSGVTLAADYSALNLSWPAASGASGTVQYYVYGDAGFSTLLGQTTATSWSLAQPTAGRSYTFGVRAQDTTGQDGNTSVVVYTVPPLTYGGCTAATAVAPGTNQITFSIPAWATQVTLWRGGSQIFVGTAAGSSPYQDAAVPLSGSSYYQCNAVLASGTVIAGGQILSVNPALAAAPTLTSVLPAAGPVSGGATLTLLGSHFSSAALVNIGTATCTSINVVSASRITCISPAHASGTGSVVVTNPDSQQASLANAFSFSAATAPTVTSVAPAFGALAGGTNILLTGTQFGSGATVQVGGVPCTSPAVVSSTSISCTVAASASSGPVAVTVTGGDGQAATLANGFTYLGNVSVSQIFPAAGALIGGTQVTVTGSGFVTGTTVAIGGVSCVGITVVSWTQLTCQTGPSSAQVASVVVTGANATTATLPSAFTYQVGPVLTLVSPGFQTDTYGGRTLAIYGATFNQLAQVTIGGNRCQETQFLSANALTCLLPAGSAGAANVTVTNPDGQTSTLLQAYTYQGAAFSQLTTLAGPPSPGAYVDATGAAARFKNPVGLTSDATNVYVADQGAYAIRAINKTSGVVTTVASSPASGCVDGVGGTLSGPTQLTIAGGVLYFIDGHALRSLNISSGSLTTIAGNCTTSGYTDGASGAGSLFKAPYAVATDGTNLFVTENTSHTIRQVVIATGATTTIVGQNGTYGSANGTGTAALFNAPTGIATDGTNLFIADSGNSVIRKLTISSGTVTTVAGIVGNNGDTNGSFSSATLGLMGQLSYNNNVLYAYSYCCSYPALRRIDLGAMTVTSILANNLSSHAVDGPVGTALALNIAGINDDGTNLYFTEANPYFAVRQVSSGQVSTLAGDLTLSGHVDGTGSQARFWQEGYIASDGQFLYTYSNDCTIRATAISTGVTSTIAGVPWTCGNVDGVGTSARLTGSDRGMIVVGSQLYFFDYNALRVVDLPSATITTLAGSAYTTAGVDGIGTAARLDLPSKPAYLAGALYWMDATNVARQYVLATGAVTTVAGLSGSSGSADGSGASVRMSYPGASTSDGTYVYFIDQGCTVLRRLVPGSWTVSTVAGLSGAGNYTDGAASVTRFNCLTDLSTDGTTVYLREQNYEAVRGYNILSGVTSTIMPGNNQDVDGALPNAGIYAVNGIVYTNSHLYFIDNWNLRYFH